MYKSNEILGFLFIFGGPVLLAYSVVSVVRTRAFLRRCAETSGEVVHLEHSTDRMGTTSYESYAPVFAFMAANGKAYRVTSTVYSSPADFNVGDCVRVRYDPANPQDARIHSFFEIWGTALISGTVGLPFSLLAAGSLGCCIK